ncbi:MULTISPECIES: type I polyketide synthase [unclassified Moorena]|uniref:type I polyketide synthase n=1 Tax=unclassified Moorena TaxID=2683338 RepID=UPI0013FED678|nr:MULTISPECIES: type I polyketide synthase [unclassified Moorena]NEO13005.1 SDR family NAD(P)-dependent oxidoreductase [Moorena sp. SIO3E8]NEQ00220.1 SDR family NAD(P)-dependent oxidoreductase [Moorena sp. SIO3F7]
MYIPHKYQDIAIIGMACRFPGANDLNSYWTNLCEGKESITFMELQQVLDHEEEPKIANHPDYVLAAPIIDAIDRFDAEFFRYSSREASAIDPQQRVLLETAWHAFENAGYGATDIKEPVGVFAGTGGLVTSYFANRIGRTEQLPNTTGSMEHMGMDKDFVSTRVSYKLDLTGPSVNIQTACSTSMVVLHTACRSILSGESEMALAAASCIRVPQHRGYLYSEGNILSQDGHCRPFDQEAKGTIFGSGVGAIVLKPLNKAIRDNDNIYAVIKSTAVNNDGAKKVSYTASSVPAQAKAVVEALTVANIEPEQLKYLECHATGTIVGDPLEIQAMTKAFKFIGIKQSQVTIGSVKANIGHLEQASGMAALIKTALILKHGKIPPQINLNQVNDKLNLATSPFKINTKFEEFSPISLDKETEQKPICAVVNSLGLGGTNGCAVLAQPPSKVTTQNVIDRPFHVLTISAKTEKALEDLVSKYQSYLETNPELALADVCYTASTGRVHFNHRLGAIASDPTELMEKLLGWKTQAELVGVFSGQPNSESPKIAFLFTGQGSQYVNMGQQLYEQAPTFRQALEQCDQILQSYLETSILEILYPQEEQKSSILDQTAYTQPAIFALEYALFKLWSTWGIKPNVVMGHSVGEYVAATVAGVFSLEDGLKLIAMRGKLMQQLPSGGEMVSVMASESQVTEAIKEYTSQVTIAAVNGPESIVISGESGAIATICTSFQKMGIKTKQLQVSHAFHSPLMEPMLTEFEAVAKQVTYNQPKIPLISNVTGTEVGAEITTAEYWVGHVRQPVRFAQSMKTLEEQGYETFLEIGSKPILLGMGRQCVTEDVGEWLPSLRPGVDEWQQMLYSLGQLYVKGVKIDWSGFESDYNRHKVALPTYPFQRARYWLENANSQTISTTKLHPLINRKFKSPLSKEIFFESEFSTHNLPFLADHLIYEKVVVPGASHISLLLAGASLTFSATGCQLEDILFPQALAIPEQGVRNVQMVLTPEDSSYSFQVISFDSSSSSTNGSSSWDLHATGKISPITESSQHSLETIKEIQSRCSQKVEGAEIYQVLWDRQIHLGDSFRWIDQVWLGEGEVLCQMKVPETVLDALQYQIHPALIDSCFQSSLAVFYFGLSGDESETFVPFSIEKFTFYQRPENRRLWCYGRQVKDGTSEEKLLKTEIQLFDQTGQLVAQVDGFKARKANPKALLMTLDSDLNDWFYEINWQAQPLTKTAKSDENISGKWLVFALNDELMESVGKNLQQKGEDYIWVSPGSEYRQLDAQHYQINPTIAEQFLKLLQDNSEIKGILHLWGINEVEDLQTVQQLGCATGLHLLQALIEAGLTDVIPMWLVTQGTQSVLDEAEVVQPKQGSLWGLGRVISSEHPELRCGRIDLDPTSQISEVIPSLVDEMFSDSNEDQIAIRQGVRYVARLVRQKKLPILESQQSIKAEASYLITGGLGALGLEVAQWMVKEGAKHIVLTGRRSPNETAGKIIGDLEAAGATVSVLLGDISTQDSLTKILEEISGSLPPLKGVIHAAGVLDDGVLQKMSWERFTKVLAPKVSGTWYLHQLTRDLPLDFFVCFSSIASMLGNSGQGNYAAANAFMDAMAHYRRGLGLPGLSINWGPWASGGMAARLGTQHQNRSDISGMRTIQPEQGMVALENLLSVSQSQVGVFPVNWSQWFQVQTGTTVPMLTDLMPYKPKQSQEGWLIEQLEAVPPEQRRQLLTNEVRRQVAQVVGTADPERIDTEAGFFDIGIDSLILTELRNRLQSILGCPLSATVLFNYANIDDLVNYLAQDVLETISFEELKDTSSEELNLTEDLSELSTDELATLLANEIYN